MQKIGYLGCMDFSCKVKHTAQPAALACHNLDIPHDLIQVSLSHEAGQGKGKHYLCRLEMNLNCPE